MRCGIWPVAALAMVAAFGPSSRTAVSAPVSSARVSRLERDLRPLIVLQGSQAPPVSLPERMVFYKVPGVSIAFIDHGRIAWTRQYGLAALQPRQPVTAATLFQAGSITKVVTALTTLCLVREGKLGLDADVNSELKSWKVPDTPFTQTNKVTVRGLLSHSAGMTVHGFDGYSPGQAIPTTLQVLKGEAPANSPPITVDKPPGSGFRYSGGGYVVLQQLIEDVTNEPFATAVRSCVLTPAGMNRSLIASPLPASRKSEAASGFDSQGRPVPGGGKVFPELGPAGLWSTPSDLARLATEMDQEMDGRSSRILDQPTMTEMMMRQAGNWGLGVDLGPPGGERRFSHNGANTGFSALLVYFPDRKQGAAIMMNGADQSGFIYEVAAAIARIWLASFQTEHSDYCHAGSCAARPLHRNLACGRSAAFQDRNQE